MRRRRRKPMRKRLTTKVYRSPFTTDRIFVKLQYAEIVLVSAALSPEYFYRGNSAFDPNLTGTGQQPLGYDQWSQMYDNYRVHGSAVVMRVANLGTSSTAISITPTNASTGGSTYVDTISNPFSKNRILGPTTGMGIGILKNYMKTVKMVGEKIFNNDNYAASTAANPTTSWFWALAFFAMDGLTTVDLSVEVKINYYVEFFKRKQIDLS